MRDWAQKASGRGRPPAHFEGRPDQLAILDNAYQRHAAHATAQLLAAVLSFTAVLVGLGRLAGLFFAGPYWGVVILLGLTVGPVMFVTTGRRARAAEAAYDEELKRAQRLLGLRPPAEPRRRRRAIAPGARPAIELRH